MRRPGGRILDAAWPAKRRSTSVDCTTLYSARGVGLRCRFDRLRIESTHSGLHAYYIYVASKRGLPWPRSRATPRRNRLKRLNKPRQPTTENGNRERRRPATRAASEDGQ